MLDKKEAEEFFRSKFEPVYIAIWDKTQLESSEIFAQFLENVMKGTSIFLFSNLQTNRMSKIIDILYELMGLDEYSITKLINAKKIEKKLMSISMGDIKKRFTKEVSDCADGFIARHFHEKTKFGAKFDMVADRILYFGTVISVLIYYSYTGYFGNPINPIFSDREVFAESVVGYYLKHEPHHA